MSLRHDGEYTIYKVQHCRPDDEWVYSNFDKFDTPVRSFTANGECWQQTGEFGTYVIDDLFKILDALREKWPDYRFRGVVLTITQTTVPV